MALKYVHAAQYVIYHPSSETSIYVAHLVEEDRDRQSQIQKFEHSMVPFKDILKFSYLCSLKYLSGKVFEECVNSNWVTFWKQFVMKSGFWCT